MTPRSDSATLAAPDRSVEEDTGAGNQPGRLGPRWLNRVLATFGLPARRRLARAALRIDAIRAWEQRFTGLSDAELLSVGRRLRGRARGGEALERLLPELFGAVCVAVGRHLGFQLFDVQLAAGIIMHEGAIAEQATGEGKTLTAILPAALNALAGKGVHVTTVNDYLAKRDAEWTGPIYSALGLTVGVLQMKMEDADRVRAYRADVTYGMASEFGFDFLRDRLKLRGGQGERASVLAPWLRSAPRTSDPFVQRGHHFAVVDEADNIFIDEARTPLVISAATRPATEEEQVVFRWADQLARKLERDRHFLYNEKKQQIRLLAAGRQQLRWSSPPAAAGTPAIDLLREHVERALHAHYRFRRDQHYLVHEDKIEIIDEATGRRMPDRHWSEGLHQAVEAKENVTINRPAPHAAEITFQSYFKLYTKLAGMTGTIAQNWREMRRVYKRRVVCVPTNRPVIRARWPDRIFPTEDAKFAAAVAEILRLKAQGRPVLIGTRSVERSEMLSRRLTEAGVEHQVLNAKEHEKEAEIVAGAGQPGKVTIATNMAGRGTDIKLGPGVAEAGGLHVLGTERHDAIRIDRQLAGRAGRQGDAGSCQYFLSLEDEILEALGPHRQRRLHELGKQGGAASWKQFAPLFDKAQRRTEYRHYHQRVDLMIYERQRQEVLKDLGADPYVD